MQQISLFLAPSNDRTSQARPLVFHPSSPISDKSFRGCLARQTIRSSVFIQHGACSSAITATSGELSPLCTYRDGSRLTASPFFANGVGRWRDNFRAEGRTRWREVALPPSVPAIFSLRPLGGVRGLLGGAAEVEAAIPPPAEGHPPA